MTMHRPDYKPPSQAMNDLLDYRGGKINLTELADLWGRRQWIPVPSGGQDDYPGLWGPEGSWDEVRRMLADGQLTWDEYHKIATVAYNMGKEQEAKAATS